MAGTTDSDCSIVVAPLSHGAGIQGLLNVARGAAAVIPPSETMDPEVVWALVEKHKVGNLFAVPTIIKMLVEHPPLPEGATLGTSEEDDEGPGIEEITRARLRQ